MSGRVAFPFLTLSDGAVRASHWACSLDGQPEEPAGDFLSNWDAASVVRIRRRVQIEPRIAASNLEVAPENLRLSLVVRIGTGTGRLPRLILYRQTHELCEKAWEKELDIEVTGEQLSLVLDVQTQVLLAAPTDDCGPLSPRRVADRVWSDSLRIRLEGEEPRFPMEVIDMSTLTESAISNSAPYYLQWSPSDWHRDFHGATRLYLNQRNTDFIERVQQQDGPTIQALLADVMTQICERLLIDLEEAEEIMTDAEPGSLGAQATAWLHKAWPDKDANFIRSVFKNRPSTFRAAFLSLAELREP